MRSSSRAKPNGSATILHTPKGDLTELRIFEPAFDSSTARKHFVETREDYERLWSYLEDAVILDNYDQYYRDCAELGDDGIPKTEIERTPWQQLWIEWVGLEPLSYHLADWPEHVEHTLELLERRARQTFEIARRSPAPFIVMVDNITASAIGPARFRKYCVRLYDELDAMLAERGIPVFSHMDGMLKPLWKDIARSRVGGLDSFTPTPDCDTTVGGGGRDVARKTSVAQLPVVGPPGAAGSDPGHCRSDPGGRGPHGPAADPDFGKRAAGPLADQLPDHRGGDRGVWDAVSDRMSSS